MNGFPALKDWRIVEKIPSDASLRTYTRIEKNGRTALLMDSRGLENPAENVRDVIRIANWLNEAGLHAPEIYEADEQAGYALLEDFGNLSFKAALENGADIREMYDLATGVLTHLRNSACNLDLPAYKNSFIDVGRRRIIDWYLPLATGQANNQNLVTEYLAIWEEIEQSLLPCPQNFLHMDFHLMNLMYLPHETGLRRCGLIDFQDAMIGPCPYDLANLLEDARADVPLPIRTAMMEKYCEGLNREDAQDMRDWTRVLATQFHCRWLGQLLKLSIHAGKSQYLVQIPRLEAYMRSALQDPVLQPLQDFFQPLTGFDTGGIKNPAERATLISSDAI